MDRISHLPNSIRDHIISHLPMEDALRTSILSTHWRHICSSLTHLNFNKNVLERKTGNKFGFKDFIYQTLLLHDGSSVEKFSLTSDFDDSYALHLQSWVSFAVRHNVKEFRISLRGGYAPIPNLLFTCKTLTVLQMNGIIVTSLPKSFVFPVLKKLNLVRVMFVDANQTNQLISSCPGLHSLCFLGCSWMNTSSESLIFSAPKLEKLAVNTDWPKTVRICAPNLNEMICLGNPPIISSVTLSSLVKAVMKYSHSSLKLINIASDYMSSIVMGLQNVVSLNLCEICLEFLIRDPYLLSHLRTCQSLKYLCLRLPATIVHAKAAQFLLKSYPNVETLRLSFRVKPNKISNCLFGLCTSILKIKPSDTLVCIVYHPMEVSSNELDGEGHWKKQELSSEIMLNNLRRVEIGLHDGSDYELFLLRFLFENANNLEDMNITYSADLKADITSQKTIHEKLVPFKKASASTKISWK